MPLLKGKVAIVAGAASGIGFETVKAFVREGAKGIVLVDLRQEALDKAIAAFSEEEQKTLVTCVADISKEEDVKRYADLALSHFGQLDISAQVAGITHAPASIPDLDVETFERVFAVNVRGPFLGIKYSVKAMRASPSKGKGCSIVIVGSQLGLDGHPGLGAYCPSKFAVRGLTQVSAAELGAEGIRVNTCAPGPIETPMLNSTPQDQWPTFAKKAMLGRLGQPEEVANAILFLASDQSSLVTGSTLKVDGGWSRWA
ncbi:hypothetical protein JCM6882_009441 [Rhodosporidiobolus microsporus]